MSEQTQFSRREAIALIGGGLAAAALGLWIAHEESQQPDGTTSSSPNTTTTTSEASPGTTLHDPEAPTGEQLSVEDYVQTYREYAQEVEAEYGIDQNVVLAQSYIETGGASSELATEANAFFGIKAKDDWNGPTYTVESPEEPAGGGPHEDIPAAFRRYQTVRESFLDYGDRITNSGYYDDAVAVRDDPLAYIESMAVVYATDSDYADKVLAKYQEVIAIN